MQKAKSAPYFILFLFCPILFYSFFASTISYKNIPIRTLYNKCKKKLLYFVIWEHCPKKYMLEFSVNFVQLMQWLMKVLKI